MKMYENDITQLLSEYKNPANKADLLHKKESGSFSVLFEFDRNATVQYFKNIKNIFGITTLYFSNDVQSLCASKVDAVFIMIPHPREMRSKIVKWAIKHKKPIYILEAGFVSSLFVLQQKDTPISFHIDCDSSIYLIGDGCNTVTNFLNSEYELTESEFEKAKRISHVLIKSKLFKYNHSIDKTIKKVEGAVLVIDQTYNDWSITAAEADPDRFDEMLEAALTENPNKLVVLKTHPDVATGKRKGNLNLDRYLYHDNLVILDENCELSAVLEAVDSLYVVSSTLGFEALLRGKVVHVFGKPFYAGWGLTLDRYQFSNRNRTRTLLELVYAIYEYSTFYCEPMTGTPASAEHALASMARVVKQYRNSPELTQYLYKHFHDRVELLEEKIVRTEKLNTELKKEFRQVVSPKKTGLKWWHSSLKFWPKFMFGGR